MGKPIRPYSTLSANHCIALWVAEKKFKTEPKALKILKPHFYIYNVAMKMSIIDT